jgi:enolase-phosphatase E1
MIRAILTDIEGTTTSVTFVFDTLFPYARREMAVAEEVGHALSEQEAVEQLIEWIDQDRKVTPLKALQGMVWEAGYRNGDFTGHVYADAVENLRRWKAEGLDLYVYSSGSVKAQQLIFGFSDAGDLTPLFSGYFDTRIGHKRETASYQAIAQQIGRPASEILFLSDICEELDAARNAGMATYWLVREGELPTKADHPLARDFNAIRA